MNTTSEQNQFIIKHIKDNTLCPFAKNSYSNTLIRINNLEDNIALSKIKKQLTNIIENRDYVKQDFISFYFDNSIRIKDVNNLSQILRKLLFYFNYKYMTDSVSSLKIEDDKWRYIFKDTKWFFIFLSNIYPENHPRYSKMNILLMQPDHSFHRIFNYKNKEHVKRNVRLLFKRKGIIYNHKINESSKYIISVNANDIVKWW
ncbi:YqcI/YcgG family protein [Chryseobacterium sp. UNC8MFCol]|uniref:YqcI/YcgG family protein n=1 Tax=Chryseobacterium sp. UNC8MFCol TaxID=1340435 RepID=UPI000A96B97F|nr:YqcI/YcgG family protein [Chryseobacterium sp. UNC8MFCol]